MTDIATNLNTIDGSLSDIKTAIVNKGGSVSGNITTFATAIDNIPSGGGSKYKIGDRINDDSNNEIGTIGAFYIDNLDNEYAVCVLDSTYRSGTYTTSWCSSLSPVTNMPSYNSYNSNLLGFGGLSATSNTQLILDYCSANDETSAACTFCRNHSFTIDGTTYYGQLPNLCELSQIYSNHYYLGMLDSTESNASTFRLRDWTGADKNQVWSSNQDDTSGWYIDNTQATDDYRTYGATDKDYGNSVVPVLEIPLS